MSAASWLVYFVFIDITRTGRPAGGGGWRGRQARSVGQSATAATAVVPTVNHRWRRHRAMMAIATSMRLAWKVNTRPK